MYKVLIVDDHKLMCDSLENALTSTGNFTVIGKLANALNVEMFCVKMPPDLIFMDICTEGKASGLDAIKTIMKKYPDIKIIAMSGFDEITYAPRAKEAGAQAFIPKSESLDFFIKAACGVLLGNIYFPETKTLKLPKGEVSLTPREMEILRLLCKPMSNKEIEVALGISEGTVKFHKANMLAKTGFVNSQDLAFYVINNGLINPIY